jgi:hypothetical protein
VIGRGLCLAARRLCSRSEIERISAEVAEQANTIRATEVIGLAAGGLAIGPAIDGRAIGAERIFAVEACVTVGCDYSR